MFFGGRRGRNAGANAFFPGAERKPPGDTRQEEDAEHPLQTGVLARKPTAALHAKETSHAKSESS
jgi:hypothetical protein